MDKKLNISQGIIGGSKAQRENRIALFETLFSDDNIKEIQLIMNDYLTVSGVPSIYCVVLQKAIDAFEALINVFYDPKRDSEKLKDIPYKDTLIEVINVCTQSQWPRWLSAFPNTASKLGVTGGNKLLGTQVTDDIVIAVLPNTCAYLVSTCLNDSPGGLKDPQPTGPVSATSYAPANADEELSKAIQLDYFEFEKRGLGILDFLQGLEIRPSAGLNYTSSQLIEEFVFKFQSQFLGSTALPLDLLDKIEDLKKNYDEKEAATTENKIVSLRTKVKGELLVMARTVFRLAYQFMVRYLPSHHNVVDPSAFYGSYPKARSVLLSLPQRL
jgi:hypothetical protein